MEESCAPLSTTSSGILADDKSDVPPRAFLECHICMDAPTDPVATACGHVFCWPCLSQWLQNTVKPCPICRKALSRNVNILPLHRGAGDAAARARASHGNDSCSGEAAAAAAAARNCFPPRPCNPLLFVPRLPGSTPESENAETMAIVRACGELVRERQRGRSLAVERARLKPLLKQRKNDLLRRKSELTQETNRMAQHIAQLERRLALANRQLPSGWSDGWTDAA